MTHCGSVKQGGPREACANHRLIDDPNRLSLTNEKAVFSLQSVDPNYGHSDSAC